MMCHKNCALWATLCILCMTTAQFSFAVPLRIVEDRLWLSADETPLNEILQAFADRGIDVYAQPGLDARVNGQLENVPMEEGLSDLLGPFNYTLNWHRSRGPAGPILLLDEIRIYRPGERDRVQRTPSARPVRRILRHPDGYAYVQDEVLLALAPGSDRNTLRQILAHVGGSIVDVIQPPGIYRIRLQDNANVPALLEELEDYAGVAHAEPNLAYEPIAPTHEGEPASSASEAPPPPLRPDQAGVAVLDSGLLQLPGLEDRITAAFNATQPDLEIGDPLGHGTQMSLLATGLVTPLEAATAPGYAPVLAVQALAEDGYSSSTDLFQAFQFAADKGASVISMSWGSSATSEFLQTFLTEASSHGQLLVAAAGNVPTGEPVYPAAYDDVLAVAATGQNGDRWPQSNYGDFVDLAAPGFADFPIGHVGPPGRYAGTSIATAYAASIFAAYRAEHPDDTTEQIRTRVENLLTDAGPTGPDALFGKGVLDARAVRALFGEGR